MHFYSRNYVYYIFFIYIIIFILLRFLQLTDVCRYFQNGDVIRVQLKALERPRVFSKYNQLRFQLYTLRFSDQQRKILEENQKKGVSLVGTVKSLESAQFFEPEPNSLSSQDYLKKILGSYYNSTLGFRFITRLLRVIEKPHCKITLNVSQILLHQDESALGLIKLKENVHKLRYINTFFLEKMKTYLPDPHASLVIGIVFGRSPEFSSDLKQQLIQAGLIHTVAASGYNVSLIFQCLLIVLRGKLKRVWILICSVTCILLYMGVASFTASILRSGVMCFFCILVWVSGRPYFAKYIFTISCLILLLLNPLLLVDISFLLSVSATFGLLWLYPIFATLTQKLFCKQNQNPFSNLLMILLDTFLISLCATLTTAPFILLLFKQLSPWAVISNTLLLWLIPILMIFTIFLLISLWIHPFISMVIGVSVWAVAQVFLKGASLFAHLPVSTLSFDDFSFKHFLAYWCVLLIIIFVLDLKSSDDA